MIVMMNVFNGFDIGNPMVDTDVIIGKIDENGYVTDDDGTYINFVNLTMPSVWVSFR